MICNDSGNSSSIRSTSGYFSWRTISTSCARSSATSLDIRDAANATILSRRRWRISSRSIASVREALLVQAGENAKSVLVIDLLQHVVRQVERVQFPETVVFANVVDPFITRFEHSEIEGVLAHGVSVFAEQNAVLILDKEFFSCARLAAKLTENGREFQVQVRQLVEQSAQSREIMRHPS